MFVDLHCDTASMIFYDRKELKKNDFSIDIDRLKKSDVLCQFFAFYIDLMEVKDPFDEFINMYDYFIKQVKKNSNDIQIVRRFEDINKYKQKGQVPCLLTIEEGEALKGDIKNLEKAYQLGIRAITLTWNYKNSLGYPNKNFTYKDKGLTEKGREFVYNMERLGMIPDCSHLSDRGFYDLIDICKKPFMATHSNAREVTNHERNLTDEMIRLLSDKGGVMGINFCSSFLGQNHISLISDMVKHISHIRNIGGIDVISLGSDFDGIENQVEINDVTEFYKLESALNRSGFTDDEIEKIFFKNAMRVLKECIY